MLEEMGRREYLVGSIGREWEGIPTPCNWRGHSHLKQPWWSLARRDKANSMVSVDLAGWQSMMG